MEPGTHQFQLAEIAVLGETDAAPPLAGPPASGEAPTTVERLRCENRDNPVGIDAVQPRFLWWMQSSKRSIRPDPTGPGFKKTIIKPQVVGDLHWVESSYDSVHGRIVSHWRKRGDQLVMEITVPANTTATVWVPAKDANQVTESGRPAAEAEGVQFLRMEDKAAVYAVDSGTYRFQSTLPKASP